MANKTGNPFLDHDLSEFFDPREYMEQFQTSGFDNKRLMEAHRKNVEALTEANRDAFEGAQAMARRQAEIVRDAMDEAAKAMQQAQSVGINDQRVANKQTEIAKNAFETALKHARELAEIGAKSQNETVKLLDQYTVEHFKQMRHDIQSISTSYEEGEKEQIFDKLGTQTESGGNNDSEEVTQEDFDRVNSLILSLKLILNSRFRHLPDFADRFGLPASCCHHTSFAARLGGRGGFALLAEVPEQRR